MTREDGPILGLVASLNSGLSDLQKTGQHERLLHDYLPAYLKQFSKIYYFSYQEERLEDFVSDPELLARVQVLSRPPRVSPRMYAVLLPFIHSKEFHRCDVFRVFQATGVLPLLFSRAKAPSLVTYGYHYARLARSEGMWIGRVALLAFLEFLGRRRASVLLATSPSLHRFLNQRCPKKQIVLIPNGVNTKVFVPRASRSAETQTFPKRVLFIGRLAPVKNLATLVKAVSIVNQEIAIEFVCVGKGPSEDELRRLATSLGIKLQLMAPVPHRELPKLLEAADAFALLSWSEGSPKVLLEALAAGVPCVVSNTDGIQQFVTHDQTALVCSPDDSDGIAQAFKRLFTEPGLAERLGRSARQQVEQRYDLERILKKEAEILRTLADRGTLREDTPTQGTVVSRWLAYSVRRRFLDESLRNVALFYHGDVLDIGGGSKSRRGRFVRPWWQALSWTSLDLEPSTHPDLVMNVEEMKIPDSSYDVVSCLETLQYTEQPLKALKEIHRVLRKGGRLIISVPYQHPLDNPNDRWRFAKAEFRALLADSGFDVKEFQSQGGVFASAAHLLKVRLRHLQNPWGRQIAAAASWLMIEALVWLDRLLFLPTRQPSRSTGYLAVATKVDESVPPLDPVLSEKMNVYYKAYYHDDLGLPDWRQRVQNRLREEEFEKPHLLEILGPNRFRSGRFLNVGCGTGGINMVASELGLASYGVEVSDKALDICRQKARARGLSAEGFVNAPAEALPFADNYFDVVYCRSVLEHVQSPAQCLREMVRVTKPGGLLYINIPNYWRFYEGHYKIFWIPFLPKQLARWYLRLRGRPSDFIQTVNYLTPAGIRRILEKEPVQIRQAKNEPLAHPSLMGKLTRLIYTALGIKSGEFWITKQ